MKSIRELYKIGKGPSSSHTMGPERAAKYFLSQTPEADGYRVTLYGSLAKTGVGHGTDRVLLQTLGKDRTEILFSDKPENELPHPNTLELTALKDGEAYKTVVVQSVGGGAIRIDGAPALESEHIYPENSFAEISQFCKWRHISLTDYVEINEGAEIWDFLQTVWDTMRTSVREGLCAEGMLPGELHLERKAKTLYEHRTSEVPQVQELQRVCAYAYAVAEQNADNGTVATAPTCGSCGVVPAVLYYLQEKYGFSDAQIIRALGVAGLFGNLVRRNASISGAECGCQAEIGTATSMAAAAMATLFEMQIEEVEYAAEIAMEHQLGLTCDPICGLVQIPCIERNAVAAKRAMDAVNLAHMLVGTRMISFDMVVKTMYETGISLHKAFRETSEGGLARLYARRGSK